jgi:hypothetical protein
MAAQTGEQTTSEKSRSTTNTRVKQIYHQGTKERQKTQDWNMRQERKIKAFGLLSPLPPFPHVNFFRDFLGVLVPWW